MLEYRFAVARRHGPPFLRLSACLADDAAALSHAHSLGAIHPQASVVTVTCQGQAVATVQVNLSPAAESVRRNVRDSEALIATSRRLLADTAPTKKQEAAGGQ